MPGRVEAMQQAVRPRSAAVTEVPSPSTRGGNIVSKVLDAAREQGKTIGGDGATVDSLPSLRRPVKWIKAEASAQGGNCVELAALVNKKVCVRDSQNKERGHLFVNQASLGELFASIRAGKI